MFDAGGRDIQNLCAGCVEQAHLVKLNSRGVWHIPQQTSKIAMFGFEYVELGRNSCCASTEAPNVGATINDDFAVFNFNKPGKIVLSKDPF